MAIHGSPWNFHGIPWNAVEMYEIPWNSHNAMKCMHRFCMGFPSTPMVFYGMSISSPCDPMDFYGIIMELPWAGISAEFVEGPCNSMGFHGILRIPHAIPVDFHGHLWNSRGIPWDATDLKRICMECPCNSTALGPPGTKRARGSPEPPPERPGTRPHVMEDMPGQDPKDLKSSRRLRRCQACSRTTVYR
eukprot:gene23401-biopygen14868